MPSVKNVGYIVPMCVCVGTFFVIKPGRMLFQVIFNKFKPPRAYLLRLMKEKTKLAVTGVPFLIGSSTLRRIPTNVISGMFFENIAVDWSGTLQLKVLCKEIESKKPTLIVCYSGVNDLGHIPPSLIIANILGTSRSFKCSFVYISIICSRIQHFIGKERLNMIKDINSQVEIYLKQNGNYFLNLSNHFEEEHFENDGLHLNECGNALLLVFLEEFIQDKKLVV